MQVSQSAVKGRDGAGRRWLTRAAVAFAVAVLVIVGVGFVTRALLAGDTNADPKTGGAVEIAILSVPVTGTIPEVTVAGVTVWQGEPSPVAAFDLGGFGPDQSLQPGTPSSAAVAGLEGNVVYLGHADDTAMILYTEAAPTRNPWDYVYEYFTGHGDRRLLRATFECCAMSFNDDGTVDPQVWLLDLEDGDVAVVQWMSVPDETAVVALGVNGEPAGFQRPIGRVAAFTLVRQPPYDVTITAYDTTGNLLQTFGPYTVEHIDLP
jgi:hypothetical protein